MNCITNYNLRDLASLDQIAKAITQERLDSFHPTWWTEHWVNFSTQNGRDLTFRFDRPAYLGTVIGSDKEAHFFGAGQDQASEAMGKQLALRSPLLVRHTETDANRIREVTERLLKGRRVTDVSVMMADQGSADYVKVGVEDGSYGVVAMRPGMLVAVEYHEERNPKASKVFGVECKDVSHKRINLAMSAVTGRDYIYTEPVKAPVFTIPDFSKKQ